LSSGTMEVKLLRGTLRIAGAVDVLALRVFRGRRGDLIKLLWWSGDGLCLFAKRLERGRFFWPQATSGTVALTQAQLSMLLEGIDWRRPVRSYTPQLAV
jgi:transposase